MKKFTRVIKTVFERQIELDMEKEQKTKQLEATSRIAVASDLQKSISKDENNEIALVQQMNQDKSDFLKKYHVKKTREDFDAALKGKETIPSVISMPKNKRDAESDSESLENNMK